VKGSIIALGAALAVGASLTACAEGGGKQAGGDELVFGQMLGVTGDYAPWAAPSIDAAGIAIDEINAQGGVLGSPVRLITEDTRSTVDGAVSGLSKLTTSSHIAVLGSLESDGQVALFDTIQQRQLPDICPSCGTPFLDERGGKYSFRITASDSDAGLIVAQVARDTGVKKLGMIVQNTEGASGPAQVAAEAFRKTGGQVDMVTIEPGASSYNSEIAKALAGNPDALYIAAGVEAGIPILREIDRRGYDVPIFVSPDLITNDIAALPNADRLQAVLTAFDTASPAYTSFAERYQAKTGHAPEPGMYDANSYDQYILFALAMEAAKSTEGPAVAGRIIETASGPGTKVYSFKEGKEALARGEDIDYDGASSNLDMNQYGNLVSPLLSTMTVQNGAWVTGKAVAVDPSLRP
jgi:ABC-type branched-subunit amino acid transport system substrate-binding protein